MRRQLRRRQPTRFDDAVAELLEARLDCRRRCSIGRIACAGSAAKDQQTRCWGDLRHACKRVEQKVQALAAVEQAEVSHAQVAGTETESGPERFPLVIGWR